MLMSDCLTKTCMESNNKFLWWNKVTLINIYICSPAILVYNGLVEYRSTNIYTVMFEVMTVGVFTTSSNSSSNSIVVMLVWLVVLVVVKTAFGRSISVSECVSCNTYYLFSYFLSSNQQYVIYRPCQCRLLYTDTSQKNTERYSRDPKVKFVKIRFITREIRATACNMWSYKTVYFKISVFLVQIFSASKSIAVHSYRCPHGKYNR